MTWIRRTIYLPDSTADQFFGEAQIQLQRNQSDCIPKPHQSSRRDHQGAATMHDLRQATLQHFRFCSLQEPGS
jgi:hypothetical protein